jgi:hypothetical protein
VLPNGIEFSVGNEDQDGAVERREMKRTTTEDDWERGVEGRE